MNNLILPAGRFKTRSIKVGNLLIGGDNPIRIQSMTTSNTRDVGATVDQIIKLADAGCEIARVTVQGIKEAKACEAIKSLLIQKGYDIPLVADIHFFPPAAMHVVDFVDKVRINPGNFADKRAQFKVKEYDALTYKLELERIEEKFIPLIQKCKKLGKALRIGTNHGSLSDRVMNRYGDSPEGMCESAFEYARICRDEDFHDFCFSMKSSNTLVMTKAYRLLVKQMIDLGWDYPLHLGVTEAGSGEDGRIKSAVGIGALLLDGLGDTIRVSLTEDPWFEIEPCKRLRSIAEKAHLPEREILLDPLPRDKKHLGKVYSFAELGKCDAVVTDDLKEELQFVDFAENRVQQVRKLSREKPVALAFSFEDSVEAAAVCGSLLLDGYASAIALEENLSFNILQAARLRSIKTEFISCPSCGRTLFDLQEVTQKVQAQTAHLAGVKIAIMGCIVNGPGEMADADFGYVGSKAGMIDLYVGKTCKEKNIPSEKAVERLIQLIRDHGQWHDVPATQQSLSLGE